MIVGHDCFAKQRFDDWRAEFVRYLDYFAARAERTLTDEDDRLLRLVKNESREPQLIFRRDGVWRRPAARRVSQDLVHRATACRLFLLIVNRKRDMRHATRVERVTARLIR